MYDNFSFFLRIVFKNLNLFYIVEKIKIKFKKNSHKKWPFTQTIVIKKRYQPKRLTLFLALLINFVLWILRHFFTEVSISSYKYLFLRNI